MNPGRVPRWDLSVEGTTMIAKRSALILGAMLGLGALAPVQAADLGGGRGGSIKDDAMPALMAQSARFYVRADGSYAAYDRPSIDIDGKFDAFNSKIDGSWAAGGGIGYYISKNWRADFTYEQRFNSDVSGTYQFNGGNNANFKFGMKSQLGLFNAYYDFDTRTRFTPYVGLGLGWVDHKTSAGSVTDSCNCTSTIDSGSNTSVAGALMAGVAVNLTRRGPAAGAGENYGGGEIARNLYLDVGYRFLYLGEAKTGAINAVVATKPVVVAADPTVSDIHAHEFRVGLRYDFR
jgi:opacity protein-like surface antigen